MDGARDTEYEYDKVRNKGAIISENDTAEFVVEKDSMTIDTPLGEYVLTRAEQGFDVEEYVLRTLQGAYSNDERAEVVEIQKDGDLTVYAVDAIVDGEYEYDVTDGEGTIALEGGEYDFSASMESIDIEDVGLFVKQDKGFDIEAFLAQYGSRVEGLWYDMNGTAGSLEFMEDGTYTLVLYGAEYYGTYTFDETAGTGKMTLGESSTDFYIEDGTLNYEGLVYTRDYVEQMGAEDLYAMVAGKYYDKNGMMGTIELFTDGTATIVQYGVEYAATYTINPFEGTGVITVTDTGEAAEFFISDGVIGIGETTYTLDYVEQVDATVTGTWYDMDEDAGVLQLNADGTAVYEFQGNIYYGTYTFDVMYGTGQLSLEYEGETLIYDMSLDAGFLIVGDSTFTSEVE